MCRGHHLDFSQKAIWSFFPFWGYEIASESKRSRWHSRLVVDTRTSADALLVIRQAATNLIVCAPHAEGLVACMRTHVNAPSVVGLAGSTNQIASARIVVSVANLQEPVRGENPEKTPARIKASKLFSQ